MGIGSAGTGHFTNSNTADRRYVAVNNTSFAIVGTIASRNLAQTNAYLAFIRDGGGGGNQAAVLYEFVNNTVEFFAPNFTGSDPRTGSGIVMPDTAAHTFGYSYNGTNYSGWLDGVLVFSITRAFSCNVASTGLVSSILSAGGANTASVGLLQWATFSSGKNNAEMAALTGNPWQLFAPQARALWAVDTAAGGAATAVVAAVDVMDTAAATAQAPARAVAAATDAPDTASATAKAAATATASATDTPDTALASAKVTATAVASATDLPDTANATANATARAVAAATDTPDTCVASGGVASIFILGPVVFKVASSRHTFKAPSSAHTFKAPSSLHTFKAPSSRHIFKAPASIAN